MTGLSGLPVLAGFCGLGWWEPADLCSAEHLGNHHLSMSFERPVAFGGTREQNCSRERIRMSTKPVIASAAILLAAVALNAAFGLRAAAVGAMPGCTSTGARSAAAASAEPTSGLTTGSGKSSGADAPVTPSGDARPGSSAATLSAPTSVGSRIGRTNLSPVGGHGVWPLVN